MEPTITTPTNSTPPRHTLRRIIIVTLLLAVIAGAVFLIVSHVQYTNLENSVKTELVKQNKAIKTAAVGGIYKQTLPKGVASTDKVRIDAKVAVTGASYCIAATSTEDTKVAYHMNEKTPDDAPEKGDCLTGTSSSTASVPGDVAVSSTGTTDITLGWSASVYATGYTVECATDASFTAGLHSQSTDKLSITITNLASSTTYYCHVAATSQNGVSAWSTTLQAETNLYAQPPKNMKATIVSSTELGYSWDAVPGAQYYMLEYTTDINFVDNVTSIRVDGTSGSIKSLQPATGYFLRAEAVTANFDQTTAAYSDQAFARTKKD